MLEACFASAGVFKKIVDSVKEVVDVARFDCNGQGIFLEAMDVCHVALVYLGLYKRSLESYRCDRDISIGLNLNVLSKVLKGASNDDKLEFSCKDEDDRITFRFTSQDGERQSEYSLCILSIVAVRYLVTDQQDYHSTAEIDSNELPRICRELAPISEMMTLSITNSELTFIASGEVTSGRILLRPVASVDKGETSGVVLSSSQPVVSEMLSIKYLTLAAKSCAISSRMEIALGTDVPVRLYYQLDNQSYMKYFIAPRSGGESTGAYEEGEATSAGADGDGDGDGDGDDEEKLEL